MNYTMYVEQLQFPRYKVVVQTVIGQQKHQDVRIASRCLWDNEHDNHASAVIQTVGSMKCFFSEWVGVLTVHVP